MPDTLISAPDSGSPAQRQNPCFRIGGSGSWNTDNILLKYAASALWKPPGNGNEPVPEGGNRGCQDKGFWLYGCQRFPLNLSDGPSPPQEPFRTKSEGNSAPSARSAGLPSRKRRALSGRQAPPYSIRLRPSALSAVSD